MKKRNKIFAFLMFAAALSWMVVACQMDDPIVKDETIETSTTSSSTDTTATPSTVTMSQTTMTLTSGATGQLSATCTGTAASTTATWISSNSSVAQVDQNGLVNALTAGTTTITVTADGISATCLLTVTSSEVTAVSVSVSPSSVTLSSVGATTQLTASVSPSNATNVTYTWTSGNTSIATVNQSGLVTAVAAGTASITLKTNGGLSATTTVTVTATTTTRSIYQISGCVGCGHCRNACPNGALTFSGGKATINASKCTGCGNCYNYCGRGAIYKTTTTN